MSIYLGWFGMWHKIKSKNSIALVHELTWFVVPLGGNLGRGEWGKRVGQSHWYWRLCCLWDDPDCRDCSLQDCLGPENQSSVRAIHWNREEETWKGLSRYPPSSVFSSHPPGYRGRAFPGECQCLCRISLFRAIASSYSSNQSIYFWPLCSQLVHRKPQE